MKKFKLYNDKSIKVQGNKLLRILVNICNREVDRIKGERFKKIFYGEAA